MDRDVAIMLTTPQRKKKCGHTNQLRPKKKLK
jgi:ribosomal protein L40E